MHYRPEDHQCVRPVVIVRGKAPKDMQNPEDYWEVLDVVPGAPLIQKPDALRLRPRRLYLTGAKAFSAPSAEKGACLRGDRAKSARNGAFDVRPLHTHTVGGSLFVIRDIMGGTS